MGNHAARSAHARSTLPGFPKERPFESREEVLAYLEGTRIACLLCGKLFRKLGGAHLRCIHGVTEDEYRETYRIPWTYGLCASATTEAYVRMGHRITDTRKANGWDPHDNSKAMAARMAAGKSRDKVYESPGSPPEHPLTLGPDGELETFTARRERLTRKRGTPEYLEMLRNRPVDPDVGPRLRAFWTGRKQSPEHLRARMKAIHGPDWEPPVPKEPEPPQEVHITTQCRGCGGEFTYLKPPSSATTRSYCTPDCRHRHQMVKNRERNLGNPITAVCAECGQEFVATSTSRKRRIRNGQRVCCSDTCAGICAARARGRCVAERFRSCG